MERFLLYSPNGKHGVNSLNCKARYDKDGNPIYLNGWQFLTEEEVQGLKDKTLAWENGKLVKYTLTNNDYAEIAKQEQIEKNLKEIAEINKWFNEIYDNQIKQAERCKRLGIQYDNKYGTIKELDSLAEQKAKQLNNLKEALKGD